jgi:hypothetical protein
MDNMRKWVVINDEWIYSSVEVLIYCALRLTEHNYNKWFGTIDCRDRKLSQCIEKLRKYLYAHMNQESIGIQKANDIAYPTLGKTIGIITTQLLRKAALCITN